MELKEIVWIVEKSTKTYERVNGFIKSDTDNQEHIFRIDAHELDIIVTIYLEKPEHMGSFETIESAKEYCDKRLIKYATKLEKRLDLLKK